MKKWHDGKRKMCVKTKAEDRIWFRLNECITTNLIQIFIVIWFLTLSPRSGKSRQANKKIENCVALESEGEWVFSLHKNCFALIFRSNLLSTALEYFTLDHNAKIRILSVPWILLYFTPSFILHCPAKYTRNEKK